MHHFRLRLPEELHREVAKMAEREERSLHAQYIYLLKKSIGVEQKKSQEGEK